MIKICLFFLASISKNFIQFLPNGSRYRLIPIEYRTQINYKFQHLFFLTEVATRVHLRQTNRRQVSTPFLPNRSRYTNLVAPNRVYGHPFQHLFFLIKVITNLFR